jgi:dipeptidyl aminopeptidase/acylaminoacyl peptidase
VRLDTPPDAHRSSACYDVQCGDGRFADVQWSADGSHLAFVSTSRDHKRAELKEADAQTGHVRTVLVEEVPTYYESDLSSTDHGAVNWRYLPRSHAVIWFSERTNFAHLYMYDLGSGRLLHPITSGHWNVVEILRVDEPHRLIYFTAVGREAGRDPYFAHLYRIGFNGRGLELLTPENANHEITFAPSGRFFADRHSTPQTPAVTVVRDVRGRIIRTIATADASPLLATGWRPPESFTVKARDGATDLYGLLFLPTRFDPTEKYPVIDWVYPGPHTGSVGSRSFMAARGDLQSLAELGFVVVAVDGMGTPLRSKSFHDASYGHMRDNTLPDQAGALRQLAERHPWIDLDRAGIYGHSGGGYAAAAAMFLYPDMFKVGVAESGNYDPAGYTDDWAEKFQGLPVRMADGRTSYEQESDIGLADRLRGHLLLMHGTMDDNVPPNLTLMLVDALVKANKDFDLIMLPNERHEYRGAASRYATRRRWDYFVRYLKGVEPPRDYPMRTPPEEIE